MLRLINKKESHTILQNFSVPFNSALPGNQAVRAERSAVLCTVPQGKTHYSTVQLSTLQYSSVQLYTTSVLYNAAQ